MGRTFLGRDVRPDIRPDLRMISRPKTLGLGCFSVPEAQQLKTVSLGPDSSDPVRLKKVSGRVSEGSQPTPQEESKTSFLVTQRVKNHLYKKPETHFDSLVGMAGTPQRLSLTSFFSMCILRIF